MHQATEEGRFPERGREEKVGGHFHEQLLPATDFDHFAAWQQLRSTSAFLSNLNTPPSTLPIGCTEFNGQLCLAIPALSPGNPAYSWEGSEARLPSRAPRPFPGSSWRMRRSVGAVCKASAEPEQPR